MRQRAKTKPLRYFFYRGNLCKKIHISRADDVITAWNYRAGKAEKYIYSDVRRNGEQAFSTKQVAKMIHRHDATISQVLNSGKVQMPQRTYTLDEYRKPYAYYWSEQDIFNLWEYFKTVHIGRPRHDGRITPGNLPSAAELRAMIRQGTVFYVKVGDEFIPTFDAHQF